MHKAIILCVYLWTLWVVHQDLKSTIWKSRPEPFFIVKGSLTVPSWIDEDKKGKIIVIWVSTRHLSVHIYTLHYCLALKVLASSSGKILLYSIIDVHENGPKAAISFPVSSQLSPGFQTPASRPPLRMFFLGLYFTSRSNKVQLVWVWVCMFSLEKSFNGMKCTSKGIRALCKRTE